MSIKISDLNPIQFWLTGQQSFNQKVNAGIVNHCFAQKWQTGDVINTVFLDDGSYPAYDILGIDADTGETVIGAAFGTDGTFQGAGFTAPMGAEGRLIFFRIVDHADYTHILAYSDPCSFEAMQLNTQLIQYANQTNYSGLRFTDGLVYNLRIETKFFQEQEVEVNESEDLSDGTVVKLSSSNKAQKYLEVEPAPFYFHRKIKRALQCNTVFIDNQFWEKESDYTPELMDERYPFYIAKTWLTQRDGFLSNIVGDINDDVATQSEGDAYDYSEHDETYFGNAAEPNDGETYFGSINEFDSSTYFGNTNDSNSPTYLGNLIDTEQGATYFGSAEFQHGETYFGDTSDDDRETYFADLIENNTKTYFGNSSEQHNATYFGDFVNSDHGWGCIMDVCVARRGALLWDDGDTVDGWKWG